MADFCCPLRRWGPPSAAHSGGWARLWEQHLGDASYAVALVATVLYPLSVTLHFMGCHFNCFFGTVSGAVRGTVFWRCFCLDGKSAVVHYLWIFSTPLWFHFLGCLIIFLGTDF